VPHYRRVLDRAGIDPRLADDPEVWSRIPRLSKEEILESASELVALGSGRSRTVWASTSGSTGQRLPLLLDANVNAAAFALFWRAWGSGGHYRPGQRQAAMKGPFHARGWSYNRPIRTLELSATALNPATARLFRRLILRYRPRFLRGYPSAMTLFCRLLEQQGESLSLPMIVSGSEILYPFQRREIEGFLGGRVYNHYTHWERAASILECQAGRLHAQEDYGHHEILDEEGRPCPPGVAGEITVTGLHNLAMPLIRYRTGDIAAWSAQPCTCGQSFPVVERIEGRRGEYLVTPSGSLVPWTAIVAGMDLFPQILCTQFIQSVPDRVEVRIVAAPGNDPAAVAALVREVVTPRLAGEMVLEIGFCDIEGLERTPVGKIRKCINRLPPAELPPLAVLQEGPA
jgi:phenylacetate-CoA ligase